VTLVQILVTVANIQVNGLTTEGRSGEGFHVTRIWRHGSGASETRRMMFRTVLSRHRVEREIGWYSNPRCKPSSEIPEPIGNSLRVNDLGRGSIGPRTGFSESAATRNDGMLNMSCQGKRFLF